MNIDITGVAPTCPHIDSVIEDLDEVVKECRRVHKSESVEDLQEALKQIERVIEAHIPRSSRYGQNIVPMEKIRRDNQALRSFAIEQFERVERLETELFDARKVGVE